MLHKRPTVIATTLALGLAVFSAVPAMADTEVTQTLKMSGNRHITASNPLTLRAKNVSSETPIKACFDFKFNGDLVDPGESLSIFPDGTNAGGVGFINIGTEPISARTICITAPFTPDILSDIADGDKSETFLLKADDGSTFTMSSVTMRLTYS